MIAAFPSDLVGSLLAANWASHERIPTIYESVLLDSETPGLSATSVLADLS
jgi:hypothetical protein